MHTLTRLAIVLSFSTLCACLIPVAQQGSGTQPSGGTAPASDAPRDPDGTPPPPTTRASTGAGAGATAAAPAQPISVTVRNSCRQTVKVFYGKDPKFGSGTRSSLSGNSVQNTTVRPGDHIWIIDEQANGLAQVTIQSGTRSVEVSEGCNTLSAR